MGNVVSRKKNRRVIDVATAVVAFKKAGAKNTPFALREIKRKEVGIAEIGRSLSYKDTSDAWRSLQRSVDDPKIDAELDQLNENERGKRTSVTLGINLPFDDNEFIRLSTDETENNNDISKLAYQSFGNEEEDNDYCDYCGEGSSILKSAMLTCGVCPRIYHKSCLKRRGYELPKKVTKKEKGPRWSCPECESLFYLISSKEREELMEIFEIVAGIDGHSITKEAYLKNRIDTYHNLVGVDMPRNLILQEETLFDCMDCLGLGLVDWWSFMPPMCVRVLSKRREFPLLRFLATKEISSLRTIFHKEDSMQRGSITGCQSRNLFFEWLKACRGITNPLNSNDDQTEKRQKANVTWLEFLKENALYILVARVNGKNGEILMNKLLKENSAIRGMGTINEQGY